MLWPWPRPLTFFKVKFVPARGTTILRICLLFIISNVSNKQWYNLLHHWLVVCCDQAGTVTGLRDDDIVRTDGHCHWWRLTYGQLYILLKFIDNQHITYYIRTNGHCYRWRLTYGQLYILLKFIDNQHITYYIRTNGHCYRWRLTYGQLYILLKFIDNQHITYYIRTDGHCYRWRLTYDQFYVPLKIQL